MTQDQLRLTLDNLEHQAECGGAPQRRKVLDLFVPGVPRGQPRPRAFARNGQARVYDPGTAEGWKSQVAWAIKPHLPFEPLDGPVIVNLTFYMPRPKSHYRTGKHAGELRTDAPRWHTGKPDVDNLIKALADCLTTVRLWRDDAQWCAGGVVKTYAGGRGPGVWITVEEAA